MSEHRRRTGTVLELPRPVLDADRPDNDAMTYIATIDRAVVVDSPVVAPPAVSLPSPSSSPPSSTPSILWSAPLWPAPRRRAARWQLAVASAAAIAMVAFAAGTVGVLIGKQLVDRTPAPPAVPSRQALDVSTRSGDLPRIDVAAVSAAVEPSVVTISADVGDGDDAGESIGSGIITTSDGEIVTNAHVVADASEIRVRLFGETEPRAARLLAIDVGNDLALLRIAGSGFPAARFATADSTSIGDEVVAIGFALDLDGQPSVTLGIVSALDRTVVTPNGALNGLVQTDAAISSGNSGGPLVNGAGEVVGINTLVVTGGAAAATNISLAISSTEALQVIASLRQHSTGSQRIEGYMGIGLGDRVDGGRGAIVTTVESGAPAGDGGVEAGDIVIEVDGTAVEGPAGLISAIRDRQPGDAVALVVLRGGDIHTLEVVLTTRPES